MLAPRMERKRLKDVAVKEPTATSSKIKLRVPNPIGTHTILNDKIIADFCKLIREGLPADAVCDYLGINQATYWNWMGKGRRYEDGNRQPNEHAIYGRFVRAFKHATARYRRRLGKMLHNRRNKQWYQPLAILERRDRRSFGRYEPAGGDDGVIDADEKYL